MDLDEIVKWADTWQLNISVPKSYIVYLRHNNPIHTYMLNGNIIPVRDEVVDLGVTVCNNLCWHSQCINCAKKANSVANAILHCFECTDVEVYMNAFDTYVRPIIEYNCYVWNPTLAMDNAIIENVQKSFTRRAFYKCGLPRMSYNDRLQFLDRDTLELRRLILSLCVFYDIYYGHVYCNVLTKFYCFNVDITRT